MIAAEGGLVIVLLSRISIPTVQQNGDYHYQPHHTSCTMLGQIFNLRQYPTTNSNHLLVVVEMFHPVGSYNTKEMNSRVWIETNAHFPHKYKTLQHLHLHRIPKKELLMRPTLLHLLNDNLLVL